MLELFYQAPEADLSQGFWGRKDTHSESLKLLERYGGKLILKKFKMSWALSPENY